jgi:hypothetical protein
MAAAAGVPDRGDMVDIHAEPESAMFHGKPPSAGF